ncbi:MAG: hypothetical protein U9R47_09735, partial [Actinomycetota bacterium]|nr:hypothetical protein [Actinomycetota bacterium]
RLVAAWMSRTTYFVIRTTSGPPVICHLANTERPRSFPKCRIDRVRHTGHYARPDLFRLTVDEREKNPVVFGEIEELSCHL